MVMNKIDQNISVSTNNNNNNMNIIYKKLTCRRKINSLRTKIKNPWHTSKLLMALVMLLVFCHVLVPVKSWDCVCNPRECEVLEPSGCPGLGVIVWDPCRCCKICARTLGESCGGFSGTCEPSLKCVDGICNGNS